MKMHGPKNKITIKCFRRERSLVIWDVAPCSRVNKFCRYDRSYSLHHQQSRCPWRKSRLQWKRLCSSSRLKMRDAEHVAADLSQGFSFRFLLTCLEVVLQWFWTPVDLELPTLGLIILFCCIVVTLCAILDVLWIFLICTLYIYIYIYIYIQGVPGGMWNTSGECSLC